MRKLIKLSIFFISSIFISTGYAWPWGPDVSKLSIRVGIRNIPSSPPVERIGGAGFTPGEPARYRVYLEVKNGTDFYIKEIIATCSVYNNDGNRVSKKKTYFTDGAEIAPRGNGVLEEVYDNSHTGNPARAECEVSSANGSK